MKNFNLKERFFFIFEYFRPYNGLWSKTMVGYGSEDKHFVLELTYNYTIGGYTLGDDYKVGFPFKILIVND